MVEPVPLGIVFGIGFAAVDMAVMFPMPWPSRRQKAEAMAAAAIERFLIGLLVPTTDLELPRWVTGVALGGALSLPSAIIARAYAPILGLGLAGGLVLGLLAQVLL